MHLCFIVHTTKHLASCISFHSTPEGKTMQCSAASTMLLCEKKNKHTPSIFYPQKTLHH